MLLIQTWFFSCLALVNADTVRTWVSLPVHGPWPSELVDDVVTRHQADVALGTPPQNTSFVINIASSPLTALTPQCVFCSPDGMYDPSYSSSAKVLPETAGDLTYGGTRGTETVTFGGILQDVRSPITFIEHMSTDYRLRYTGGQLGLFVPQLNQTRRQQSVLVRMDEQGQLLNPVWGLRIGGDNPRLTIGALDPNDYQGEINWVPAVNDSAMIQVDALRGYQGNAFQLQYPINAWLDSFTQSDHVVDLDLFMGNASLTGPQESIALSRDNDTFFVLCNDSRTPDTEVRFSVEINGVDYLVNQTDLVRPSTSVSEPKYCAVGLVKSDVYALGVTFLRSVYLAYRFPTGNCPGYWGFAIRKGGPAPTSTQKPKVTPTDAATCLSFTNPSSTPTPTIATHTGLFGSNGEKYSIYGQSTEQWVELRNVDELPPLKVNGGTSLFGG